MKLQRFDGGLNIREGSHLIKIDEAIEYTNISNERGVLEPVTRPQAAGVNLNDRHRYIKFSKSIEDLEKKSQDLIEYKNKIYYSVADDFVQIKDPDNGITGDLGLWPPAIGASSAQTVRPPTPVAADITITSINYLASFVPHTNATSWLSQGETVTFAFQRVGNDGALSDVFVFNYTINTGLANSFGFVALSLPYNYKVYSINAGVWREASGATHFDTNVFLNFDFDNIEVRNIGVANLAVHLHKAQFVTDENRAVPNYVGSLGSPLVVRGDPPLWPTSDASQTGSRKIYLGVTKTVDLDLVTTSGQDLPDGTYFYVATVANSILGWESEPSGIASVEITTGVQANFTIDGLASDIQNQFPQAELDPRINRVNIYRSGGTIAEFTLVTSIENPTFPISFQDTFIDEQIAGNPQLQAEDYDKPPIGLKNLAMVNGQLCGTVGTRLYFGLADKLYAMPVTNYREFRENLTGIREIDAGLLIMSLNKTWLLNTSNLSFGKPILLSDEFGCTGHNTIASYRTGAMWHCLYGVAVSFGGKVELYSKNKLGYKNLNVIRAVIHNETYWGFTVSGTIWAIDLRYSPAIKFFDFALFADNIEGTKINQVYREDDDLRVLWGSQEDTDSYTIFGATTLATFTWKSPKFIEGSYGERKTYKDIFVRATKDLKFKVYIEDQEDNLVADETFNETETHHIKVDGDALQGYAIRFEVTGTGKLFEIEYKAMGRQSGR